MHNPGNKNNTSTAANCRKDSWQGKSLCEINELIISLPCHRSTNRCLYSTKMKAFFTESVFYVYFTFICLSATPTAATNQHSK